MATGTWKSNFSAPKYAAFLTQLEEWEAIVVPFVAVIMAEVLPHPPPKKKKKKKACQSRYRQTSKTI